VKRPAFFAALSVFGINTVLFLDLRISSKKIYFKFVMRA